MKKTITYKDSGVDISAGNEAVNRIKGMIKETHSEDVLVEIGTFGALYDLGSIVKNYRHPVLVQSIDSVGTKLMVANMMGYHGSIGIDMVAHSCNDILCQGAKPLTFLDYIAVDKLSPDHIQQIVEGITKECKEAGISLIGGETAELPGVYASGEYDLVGAVTGVVEKDKIILGKEIEPGDIIIGLESSGLHTNGYSLARKVLFSSKKYKVDSMVSELGTTVGEALLKPHRNYSRIILSLLEQIKIKGIAHITGGGLIENIPRILPPGCSALINKKSWTCQPIFSLIKEVGNVPEEDLYRTLNMGIGLVLVLNPDAVASSIDFINSRGCKAFVIGEIVKGTKKVCWK